MKNFYVFCMLSALSFNVLAENQFSLDFLPAHAIVRKLSGDEIESAVRKFNKTAAESKIPIHLEACGEIYYMAPGGVSRGAICKISNSEESAFVCDDNMVGHFSIVKKFISDPEWIAEKIYENCFGG